MTVLVYTFDNHDIRYESVINLKPRWFSIYHSLNNYFYTEAVQYLFHENSSDM